MAFLTQSFAYAAAGLAALAAIVPAARARLLLSRAKHRSLAGHSNWSRRIAAHLPYYGFDEAAFFRADGAPADIAALGARACGGSPLN